MTRQPESAEPHRPLHKLVELILSAAAGSINDLAKDLDVKYATLYSWATGRREPTRDNLARLAELADQRADLLRDTAEELRAIAKGEIKPPGPHHHGRSRSRRTKP